MRLVGEGAESRPREGHRLRVARSADEGAIEPEEPGVLSEGAPERLGIDLSSRLSSVEP
jgi:hypothetical protein